MKFFVQLQFIEAHKFMLSFSIVTLTNKCFENVKCMFMIKCFENVKCV